MGIYYRSEKSKRDKPGRTNTDLGRQIFGEKKENFLVRAIP